MNPRGVDARTSPRVPIRLSAEVRHGEATFTATTRDLSVGGVCLEASFSLPEGDLVQVGLFLVVDDVEDASQPPLQVYGRVAWAAPAEPAEGRLATMGVRFQSMTGAQISGLTRILKVVPSESAA
jgi:hypothetical protein